MSDESASLSEQSTRQPRQNDEQAVRAYLAWIEHPESLIDEGEVERLDSLARSAEDPIERLHAFSALERARTGDAEQCRASFITSAKRWADRVGVSVGAFREMRVDDTTLQEAGFDTGRGRGRRSGSAGSSASTDAQPRKRAESVSTTALKEFVGTLDTTFTLNDVQRGAGGSDATVRKAVEEMVTAGQVTRVGPDPSHSTQGRAPILYRRIG